MLRVVGRTVGRATREKTRQEAVGVGTRRSGRLVQDG